MIDLVQKDHPENWQQILNANNERAPMTLRVNAGRQSRDVYLERLRAQQLDAQTLAPCEQALVLATPAPVGALPGFEHGDVSVQDAAAQLAAVFLDAQPGQRVLDACAAPGGKTAHLLERTPGLALLALDTDNLRTPLIETNLKRLGLQAELRVVDAAETGTWWDGRSFDRILLDVPCSASGVIRRHPDIKLRRQPADLLKLEQTQTRLLTALWPLLAPGGKLLYTTCSVFARENEDRIAAFLASQADAAEVPLACAGAQSRRHGLQVLPGTQTMDGFFYACLVKR
jgi:16S rRNA (cytosine967-C5)-methyltransferase